MEAVSSVSDAITALAAIVGIVLAIFGLRAWKAELRGRTEYDIAKRLLTNAYLIESRLTAVRSPLMVAGEWADRSGDQNETAAEARQKDAAHAYQKRWDQLAEPRSNFMLALHESRAVLQPCVYDAGLKLSGAIGKLNRNIQFYLQMMANDQLGTDGVRQKVELIIWAGAQDPDGYAVEVETAISEIADALKRYL